METATDIQDFSSVGTLALEPKLSATARQRLNDFYELTKPRMNFLVVITTMVGYYMAAQGWSDWRRLVATLFGTALTAAGAQVTYREIADLSHTYPRDENGAILDWFQNPPHSDGEVAR